MITYRKATIDDAKILARLRSEFLAEISNNPDRNDRVAMEKANLSYLESALLDDSFVAWLAIDNGKIVSTSGLSFYQMPPSIKCLDGRVAYIMNIYTISSHRKQGIGKEIFHRILEEAKSRGYHKITLNATKMGRRLYEKFNFIDVDGDMVLYY